MGNNQMKLLSELKGHGGPFYKHGLTLIPALISNHLPGNVWDEITDPY